MFLTSRYSGLSESAWSHRFCDVSFEISISVSAVVMYIHIRNIPANHHVWEMSDVTGYDTFVYLSISRGGRHDVIANHGIYLVHDHPNQHMYMYDPALSVWYLV